MSEQAKHKDLQPKKGANELQFQLQRIRSKKDSKQVKKEHLAPTFEHVWFSYLTLQRSPRMNLLER